MDWFKSKVRLTVGAFFLLVVVFAFIFFKINKTKNDIALKKLITDEAVVQENTFSGAFIDPTSAVNSKVELKGKVVYIEEQLETLEYEYKLVSEDGETLAYLMSKGELLKFAESSSSVTISGEKRRKETNGVLVIFVNSFSFK